MLYHVQCVDLLNDTTKQLNWRCSSLDYILKLVARVIILMMKMWAVGV